MSFFAKPELFAIYKKGEIKDLASVQTFPGWLRFFGMLQIPFGNRLLILLVFSHPKPNYDQGKNYEKNIG
jgi:hypothetical protein